MRRWLPRVAAGALLPSPPSSPAPCLGGMGGVTRRGQVERAPGPTAMSLLPLPTLPPRPAPSPFDGNRGLWGPAWCLERWAGMAPGRGCAGAATARVAVTRVAPWTVLPAGGTLAACSCRDGRSDGTHACPLCAALPGFWTGLLLLWAVLAFVGVCGGGGAEADVAVAVSSTVVLGGVGGTSVAAADRRRWGRRGGAGAGASGCYASTVGGGSSTRLLGVIVAVSMLLALMATAPR